MISIAAAIVLAHMSCGLECKVEEYRQVSGTDVQVTSYLRTSKEQAELMVARKQGLRRLYKKGRYLDEILRAADNVFAVRAVTKVIDRQMKKGFYISNHLCGSAIDVRTRNLTSREIKSLIAWFEVQPKYKVINEGNHIHIAVKEGCNGR
jgi:hypothetical protein